MLCTQYIRHASNPEYTPEPDIVHEVIGHVPMFTDPDFVEFSELLGRAALKANEEELKQIERLYWFTIEFGLIQEKELKVYGAGLLSSFGEIQHCMGVEKLPFDLQTVIETDYDYTKMQDKLFVIQSFKDLRDDSEKFLTQIICR